MTLTTNTLKPGANKILARKLGDGFKVGEDNGTQYPRRRMASFAIAKTKRPSHSSCCVCVILLADDNRKMVRNVGIISRSIPRIIKNFPLALERLLRPINLDREPFRLISCCGVFRPSRRGCARTVIVPFPVNGEAVCGLRSL